LHKSIFIVGRAIAVGIVTCYGQDGSGIKSQWGVRFSALIQTSPGAHPDFYTLDTGSFLGIKRPGRGVDHPPLSSAEVKERVAILLLHLCAFMACYRVNFVISI
jgi:hypothetical protein